MSSSKYVYNYTMTNNNYQDVFDMHYSYNKDPENENNYFETTNDGLIINIYKDDLSFLKGSETFPRSEIRGLDVVKDNVTYILSWDQCIKTYPNGYNFSFCQIFGKEGPNMILRWHDKKYEFISKTSKDCVKIADNDISNDIGNWVNWKIDFLLLNDGGLIRIYKDNICVVELIDINTSGSNDSYIKLGIYSQGMNVMDDMSIGIKNVELSYL